MSSAKTDEDMNEGRRRAAIAGGVIAVAAIAVVGLFLAMPDEAPKPDHADAEKKCMDFVQGNIPWNRSGDDRWASHALEKLCKGTTRHSEPGLCFDQVMHGGVSWGHGTRWRWREAAALCAGTNDARKRIACFTGKIDAGQDWRTAIAECGKKDELKPEDQCFSFVQGNIPWNDNGNVNWNPEYIEKLCRGTEEPAQPGLCFHRVRQGVASGNGETRLHWSNAVELCAGTNDAEARVKCFIAKIDAGKNPRIAVEACRSWEGEQSLLRPFK